MKKEYIYEDLIRFSLREIKDFKTIQDIFDDFQSFLDFSNFIEQKYSISFLIEDENKQDFLFSLYSKNILIFTFIENISKGKYNEKQKEILF